MNSNTSSPSANQFLKQAKTSPVEVNEWPSPVPPTSTPKWVRPELVKAGQRFIQQHFFGIYFSHFISLLLLFCYEPIRFILLRTGKSAPSSKSLHRYFSTLSHLKLWYEGNLLDENSAASRDIQSIRVVHAKVAKAFGQTQTVPPQSNELGSNERDLDMNNNSQLASASVKGEGGNIVVAVQMDFIHNQFLPTWRYADDPALSVPVISQLDMLITQFCFMGLLSVFPKIFGIFTSTKSEKEDNGLAGFLHLWALVGHRLGIQDRFNLCLDSDGFHANQKIQIVKDIYLHSLVSHHQSTKESILALWTSLIDGIAYFIPFMSLPAMLTFIMVNVLDFKHTPSTDKHFTIYDTICLRLMNICFSLWLPNALGRAFLNQLLRFALVLTWIRLYYLAPAIRIVKKLSSN